MSVSVNIDQVGMGLSCHSHGGSFRMLKSGYANALRCDMSCYNHSDNDS